MLLSVLEKMNNPSQCQNIHLKISVLLQDSKQLCKINNLQSLICTMLTIGITCLQMQHSIILESEL